MSLSSLVVLRLCRDGLSPFRLACGFFVFCFVVVVVVVFVVVVLLCPYHSLSTSSLSATGRRSRRIYILPDLVLESAKSARSSGSFWWRMVIRNQDTGAGSDPCCWGVTAPMPFQWTRWGISAHARTFTSLSVCLSIYENDGFTVTVPVLVQHHRFIHFFPSHVCNSLFQPAPWA